MEEVLLDCLTQDREFPNCYRLSVTINNAGFSSDGVFTLEEISKRFSLTIDELKNIIR